MSSTTAVPSHSESPKVSFGMVAGICAVLLVGMLFGASLWVLAAVAAAILVGVNWFLANSWTDSTIAVRHSGNVEHKLGSVIDVEITLTNQSRLPILWILVEDLLPRPAIQTGAVSTSALEIEGDRVQVMMLWAGESKSLHYQVTCRRRGYFQIGPTVLETGDLMGLYRRYRVGTEPQYVTVLPDVVPLSTYDIGSRRPIGEIRMRDNVMDDPTRLRGIRQWQTGDPLRSVHWAATARTGTLHSKIYEPSSIAGATLILDLHVATNPSKHEPVRSDLAVTAAASIAHALHDAGEPFGLVTNGRDAADRIRTEGWVGDYRVRDQATAAAAMRNESDRLMPVSQPATRGPVALREMVRTLARLERTDGLTLAELLVEAESRISSETTVLVILQHCPPESMAALIGLSRRGRAVAVIINALDINEYSAVAGPLIACRIPTFHLASADAVSDVCREVMTR
ncbi:DUF58 domain-containing protein [Novipirellula maiorica]|uniref:DUF58 domain-containing protein n=1 Tax=Novipirellula maiorica TaxID=1265734 RepID=UPI00034BF41C|nr:DUF58 domain-containing protein [Rhodopirellula maiorica]